MFVDILLKLWQFKQNLGICRLLSSVWAIKSFLTLLNSKLKWVWVLFLKHRFVHSHSIKISYLETQTDIWDTQVSKHFCTFTLCQTIFHVRNCVSFFFFCQISAWIVWRNGWLMHKILSIYFFLFHECIFMITNKHKCLLSFPCPSYHVPHITSNWFKHEIILLFSNSWLITCSYYTRL